MNERVFITGTGVVSSIGAGQEEFLAALYAGLSGIKSGSNKSRAEIPDFDPQRWLGPRGWRGLDRTARLHSVAAFMALEQAAMAEQSGDGGYPDVGMVCGTMFGSLHTIASFDLSVLQDGPTLARPLEFANCAINSSTDQAAIRLRLRAMNWTLSAGLASGILAVEHGANCVRLGRARAMLAGGVDALCDELCAGLADAGLTSASGVARPFAAGRDGIVPGEASAVFMLETEASARSRDYRPNLEICGSGAAHSAHPAAAQAAAESAVRLALASAGIGAGEISCIVTSGSGSRNADRAEALALASVFGTRLPETPACAPKAAFGECMGSSGALLLLVAAGALGEHCLPPTPGSNGNEYGLQLAPEPQHLQGNYALVDAIGEDNSAALVLRCM